MTVAVRVKRRVVLLAAIVVAGCAGYDLQLGTGGFGEFTQLYAVPASSLAPWAGRNSQLPLPPPPSDGGPGSSTLPAARSDLPPDRSPSPSSR